MIVFLLKQKTKQMTWYFMTTFENQSVHRWTSQHRELHIPTCTSCTIRPAHFFDWQVVCFTVTSCWPIPILVGVETRGPTVLFFSPFPFTSLCFLLFHPALLSFSLFLGR